MRYFEIVGGARVPVSLEEQEILDRVFASGGCLRRAELDERGRELARRMVTRGVLKRTRDAAGRVVFVAEGQQGL